MGAHYMEFGGLGGRASLYLSVYIYIYTFIYIPPVSEDRSRYATPVGIPCEFFLGGKVTLYLEHLQHISSHLLATSPDLHTVQAALGTSTLELSPTNSSILAIFDWCTRFPIKLSKNMSDPPL